MNRRDFLKGLGITALTVSSVGGALAKVWPESRYNPMAWYGVWEGWSAEGKAFPIIALGNTTPEKENGITPIRRVFVFRTDAEGKIARVLNRKYAPDEAPTLQHEWRDDPESQRNRFSWFEDQKQRDHARRLQKLPAKS